jgi:histidinol-phosphate phosphatase family protein
MSGRAAFLDRDGTINEKAPEGDYVTTPERFRFLDGAEEAVRMLAGDGWRVVVVTNQGGVALGRMTLDDVERVNERMAHLPISGVFVCPHERDSCDCRKPGTAVRAGPGRLPGDRVRAVGGDRRRRVGHAGRPCDRCPHVPGRPAAAAVAAGRRPEHRLRHHLVTTGAGTPTSRRHLASPLRCQTPTRPAFQVCAARLTGVTTGVTPIWLERSVAPESGV